MATMMVIVMVMVMVRIAYDNDTRPPFVDTGDMFAC